jgi:hypothetical protein
MAIDVHPSDHPSPSSSPSRSCFYTLFRVDAYEKSRDPHSNYVWSSTPGVFLSLLSILLGNFDPNEFIHSHVSTMAIIFLVAYIVLGSYTIHRGADTCAIQSGRQCYWP